MNLEYSARHKPGSDGSTPFRNNLFRSLCHSSEIRRRSQLRVREVESCDRYFESFDGRRDYANTIVPLATSAAPETSVFVESRPDIESFPPVTDESLTSFSRQSTRARGAALSSAGRHCSVRPAAHIVRRTEDRQKVSTSVGRSIVEHVC